MKIYNVKEYLMQKNIKDAEYRFQHLLYILSRVIDYFTTVVKFLSESNTEKSEIELFLIYKVSKFCKFDNVLILLI